MFLFYPFRGFYPSLNKTKTHCTSFAITFTFIWNLYNKITLPLMAAVRVISWNGSSSGDGKSLLLISSWISALSLCGDHSSWYTAVIFCSQIWQLCLCLVPPLSYTDRWQQSLNSVSLISAGYERERAFPYLSLYLSLAALSLSRPLCFTVPWVFTVWMATVCK